jgi:hypothetical protein
MRKDEGGLNGLTHVFVAMGAVAFFVAGVPILDAFGGWVSNLLGLQSVKLNSEAGKIAAPETEQKNTHVIGFNINPETEEEEIEDE